jgi:hypothetical protein
VRTTIDIPDDTYRELKVRAARESKTVREIVLKGIQSELAGRSAMPPGRFEVPVIRSKRPGTLALTPEQIDEIAFS